MKKLRGKAEVITKKELLAIVEKTYDNERFLTCEFYSEDEAENPMHKSDFISKQELLDYLKKDAEVFHYCKRETYGDYIMLTNKMGVWNYSIYNAIDYKTGDLEGYQEVVEPNRENRVFFKIDNENKQLYIKLGKMESVYTILEHTGYVWKINRTKKTIQTQSARDLEKSLADSFWARTLISVFKTNGLGITTFPKALKAINS